MGYSCTLREVDFKISADNISKVIEALVQSDYFYLFNRSDEDCLKIACGDSPAEKQQLLFELFDSYEYRPRFDEMHNVIGLEYYCEKWCEDDKIFDVFAKYVEKGSYIEMGGEDGTVWRMLFDGEHCREINPVIAWPDCEKIQKELAPEQESSKDANILLKPLGNSIFVTWHELDVAFNNWARAHFGSHVYGGANRDETDVEIALVGLKSSDFKNFAKLFELYDKEQDFDAKAEFCIEQQIATLPDCVSRGVLGELLQETNFGAVGHFTATYNGVFITEKEFYFNDMLTGDGFVSVGYNLPSKMPLDKQIEAAQSKVPENVPSTCEKEIDAPSAR